MNQFNAIGRITKDLEMKTTQNGKNYIRFSLAIRRDKDNADFVNCVAWNKTAEMLDSYCCKGQQIGLNGELRSGSYEDKNGNKVYTLDCWVNKLDLLEKKDNSTAQKSNNTVTEYENNDYEDNDDEEFPF